MVERHFDATRLNEILNHPCVRSDVADLEMGTLDLTAAVADRNNVLLVGEFGAFLLLNIMPGVFETHSQCLPDGRGSWMAAFLQTALDWFFTNTNGWEIVTRVPKGHLAARALCRMAGFREEFTRQDHCRFRGRDVPVSIWRLSIHDWVERSAQMERLGDDFHERLNAEALRLGIATPPHPDDPQHNRIVGATFAMARLGGDQIVKAILFYLRWAYLARHEPISLVSRNPPAIKMDIGIITLRGKDGIEVTPC